MATTVNFLDNDTALKATDSSGSLRKIQDVTPSWQFSGGSAVLSDAESDRLVPNFFAYKIQPNNSTGTVNVYIDYVPIPAANSADFDLMFHAQLRGSGSLYVSTVIAESNQPSPTPHVTNTDIGRFSQIRSNHFVPDDITVESFVRVQMSITEHNGEPIYFTIPALIDDNAFYQNQVVQNARKFMPSFYWDIDSQQEDPDNPLFKLIDVLSTTMNDTVSTYANWFDYELGELSPSFTGLEQITRSTLTDAEYHDPSVRSWLAQFTGHPLIANIRSEQQNYLQVVANQDMTDPAADGVVGIIDMYNSAVDINDATSSDNWAVLEQVLPLLTSDNYEGVYNDDHFSIDWGNDGASNRPSGYDPLQHFSLSFRTTQIPAGLANGLYFFNDVILEVEDSIDGELYSIPVSLRVAVDTLFSPLVWILIRFHKYSDGPDRMHWSMSDKKALFAFQQMAGAVIVDGNTGARTTRTTPDANYGGGNSQYDPTSLFIRGAHQDAQTASYVTNQGKYALMPWFDASARQLQLAVFQDPDRVTNYSHSAYTTSYGEFSIYGQPYTTQDRTLQQYIQKSNVVVIDWVKSVNDTLWPEDWPRKSWSGSPPSETTDYDHGLAFRIIESPSDRLFTKFGYDVAITDDGNTVFASAVNWNPEETTVTDNQYGLFWGHDQGCVYVFDWDPDALEYVQRGDPIYVDGETVTPPSVASQLDNWDMENGGFGTYIDITPDGSVLSVTSMRNVYIFVWDGQRWVQDFSFDDLLTFNYDNSDSWSLWRPCARLNEDGTSIVISGGVSRQDLIAARAASHEGLGSSTSFTYRMAVFDRQSAGVWKQRGSWMETPDLYALTPQEIVFPTTWDMSSTYDSAFGGALNEFYLGSGYETVNFWGNFTSCDISGDGQSVVIGCPGGLLGLYHDDVLINAADSGFLQAFRWNSSSASWEVMEAGQTPAFDYKVYESSIAGGGQDIILAGPHRMSPQSTSFQTRLGSTVRMSYDGNMITAGMFSHVEDLGPNLWIYNGRPTLYESNLKSLGVRESGWIHAFYSGYKPAITPNSDGSVDNSIWYSFNYLSWSHYGVGMAGRSRRTEYQAGLTLEQMGISLKRPNTNAYSSIHADYIGPSKFIQVINMIAGSFDVDPGIVGTLSDMRRGDIFYVYDGIDWFKYKYSGTYWDQRLNSSDPECPIAILGYGGSLARQGVATGDLTWIGYSSVERIYGYPGSPQWDSFTTTSPEIFTGYVYAVDGPALALPTTVTSSSHFNTTEAEAFAIYQMSDASFGWASGSRDAIVSTVQQVLSGDKTVALSPNYRGIDWRIHIRTVESETPDVDPVTNSSMTVLNIAELARPMGFVFSHAVQDAIYLTLNNVGVGRLDLFELGGFGAENV